MPKFTVLVAHDVPHYGTLEIDAADADQALAKVRNMDITDVLGEACNDPAFHSSICARVVHIEDEAGNVAHEDTPLDQSYAAWAAVDDLTSVLREAEAYLSGFDTRQTPAMLARRINAALGRANEA